MIGSINKSIMDIHSYVCIYIIRISTKHAVFDAIGAHKRLFSLVF